MVRVKHDKARGILNAEAQVTRFWPSDDLAAFVEHYWIVRWNLAEPPGGFRAFVDRSVAFFTDRRWHLPSVFGPRAERLDAEVLSHDDDLEAVGVVESFLRSFAPAASDAIGLAGRITERIADDRTITRVDQVVEQFAIPARQMQRLFRDYVGVTPKWVIQRYRLIEGAEQIAAGAVADFASLALDLGYADQAHFTRDFKKIVGRAPAGFARSLFPR